MFSLCLMVPNTKIISDLVVSSFKAETFNYSSRIQSVYLNHQKGIPLDKYGTKLTFTRLATNCQTLECYSCGLEKYRTIMYSLGDNFLSVRSNNQQNILRNNTFCLVLGCEELVDFFKMKTIVIYQLLVMSVPRICLMFIIFLQTRVELEWFSSFSTRIYILT